MNSIISDEMPKITSPNVRAAPTGSLLCISTLEGAVLQGINGHTVEETCGLNCLGHVLSKVI